MRDRLRDRERQRELLRNVFISIRDVIGANKYRIKKNN